MTLNLGPLIDEFATATGYACLNRDAAANLAATNPAVLRRWLRHAAELAAADHYQELLHQAWKNLQHTTTATGNDLDADLADNARTVHTISCAWLAAEQERLELLAAFSHIGHQLGILIPASPGPATSAEPDTASHPHD